MPASNLTETGGNYSNTLQLRLPKYIPEKYYWGLHLMLNMLYVINCCYLNYINSLITADNK